MSISRKRTKECERLLVAIEAGEFGIWEFDPNTLTIDASATFRLHLNLAPAIPLALDDMLNAIHREHRESFADALHQVLKTGSSLDFDLPSARETNRWLKLKAQATRGPCGRVTAVIGISQNVTEPRRAFEELQQMQTLIRGVLETETGLIYAKDRDGRMLVANPPVLKLIGKPWTQVQGKTDAEFLNDSRQGEVVMENDRRIMVSGVPEVLEEQVDLPDGRIAVWLSTKSPLRDAKGDVVGLVGVSQDISERKHIEKQLRDINDSLEQRVLERTRERDRAWSNSQDLQLILEPADGTMTAINPAWTAVLGWSADELIGRSFLDFLHPEHLQANHAALVQARSARLTKHENRYRHKDGSYRWIEWVTAPEGDRIYASGRHVTAEKEAAIALAAKAMQLEISNRELDSFSYSVSHDLRAPIRAIDGFANILAQEHAGGLDKEGRRLLTNILRNSHRMGLLIDDLLSFSRLSHVPICSTDVDVQLLVSDVIAETTREMPTPGPQIRQHELSPARADRALLRQVWTNLISNAVKYSSKNLSPQIDISSQVLDLEVVYTVRDNGVGFDMKYASNLFGVFHRLHSNEDFKGTGVGLALAQRIVNRHGGRIWAESNLGEGAAFHFSLPA